MLLKFEIEYSKSTKKFKNQILYLRSRSLKPKQGHQVAEQVFCRVYLFYDGCLEVVGALKGNL